MSVLLALSAPACDGTGGAESGAPSRAPFDEVTASLGPSGGGGTGPIAPESMCNPLAPDVLSLAAASRDLSWTRCNLEGFNAAGSLYAPEEGQRELTDEEVASIADAVANLRVGEQESTGCGPDAALLTLDVRRQAETKLYMSCRNSAITAMTGRVEASGVLEVWTRLEALSGQ